MKTSSKVLALITMLILVGSVSAGMPVDKGNIYLAGGFAFAKWGGDLNENSNGDTPTEFVLNPALYYFVNSGFSFGGEFLYDSWSWGDSKYTGLGFGAGTKYYFVVNKELTEAKGAMYPYLGATFMFVSMKSEYGTSEDKDTGYDIVFNGGAVYMLSDAVGAFGQLGYDIQSIKNDDAEESVSGNILSFQVGITYFIIK